MQGFIKWICVSSGANSTNHTNGCSEVHEVDEDEQMLYNPKQEYSMILEEISVHYTNLTHWNGKAVRLTAFRAVPRTSQRSDQAVSYKAWQPRSSHRNDSHGCLIEYYGDHMGYEKVVKLTAFGTVSDSLGCQTTMTAMDVALSTKVFIWSAMVFIWSALVFTFECSSGHLWW